MSCTTPEQACRYRYDQVPQVPVTSRKRSRSPSQPGRSVFKRTRRCLAYFYPSPERTSRMEMVEEFLPAVKRRMTEHHKAKPMVKPSPKTMAKPKRPSNQRKELINQNLSLCFEEISLSEKQQKTVVDDDCVHFSATMMPLTWVRIEDSDRLKVRLDLT